MMLWLLPVWFVPCIVPFDVMLCFVGLVWNSGHLVGG